VTWYSRFSLFFIFCISPFTLANQTIQITLGYPEFQPYTFTNQSQPRGEGVDRVLELGHRLGWKITFEPVGSYGKGVQWLKKGKIDGLFLASQNNERDKIGRFSEPLTINRWVWFTRKNEQFNFESTASKTQLRIATHLHANTHKWLIESNYQAIAPTTDVQAMLRQLMKKRVDAVFLAERVFHQALAKSHWTTQDLETQVQVAKPFGIYIRHPFMQQHPNLMTELNQQIRALKPSW